MGRLAAQLVEASIARPGRFLLFGLAVAALSVASVRTLSPAVSLTSFTGATNSAAAALERMQLAMGATESLLVVVQQSGPAVAGEDRLLEFAGRFESVVASTPTLQSMVMDLSWEDRRATALRAFTEDVVLPAGLLYLQPAELDEVLSRFEPEAMRRQMAQNEALLSAPGATADALARQVLKDPLRLHALFDAHLPTAGGRPRESHPTLRSPDGTTLLIQLTGREPVSAMDFTRPFVQRVRQAVAEAQPGELSVALTGPYAIAELAERTIRADMIISVFSAAGLILVVFVCAYRSVREFLLCMPVVGLGILAGFGVFALLRQSINPATAAAGAILAGLGIDYGVHVLSHIRSHVRTQLDPSEGGMRAAIAPALTAVRRPVCIAAASTIIGFLVISQSSVQALQEFGLLGALGLIGALGSTLLLLPAGLALTCRWCAPNEIAPQHDGLISLLLSGASRRPKACVRTLIVCWVGALCVVIVSGIVPPGDGTLRALHPEPNAPLDLQEELAIKFDQSIDAPLVWMDAVDEEPLVQSAWDVRRSLLKAGALEVLGIAPLLPDPILAEVSLRRLRELDGPALKEQFLSVTRETIFQPKAFDEYGSFLSDLVDVTAVPDLARLQEFPGVSRRILGEDGQGAVLVVNVEARSQLPQLEAALASTPHATLTGLSEVGRQAGRSVQNDLAWLGLLALACIAALLMALSMPVPLVLLPAVMAITIILALMHLMQTPFNMINVLSLPLLIGIGIDDGVFLVSAGRRARSEGLTRGDFEQQCRPIVHAMLVTTATTGLAFGSLLLTSTPAMQSLGVLTAIGVMACFVATVGVVFPILCSRLEHQHG